MQGCVLPVLHANVYDMQELELKDGSHAGFDGRRGNGSLVESTTKPLVKVLFSIEGNSNCGLCCAQVLSKFSTRQLCVSMTPRYKRTLTTAAHPSLVVPRHHKPDPMVLERTTKSAILRERPLAKYFRMFASLFDSYNRRRHLLYTSKQTETCLTSSCIVLPSPRPIRTPPVTKMKFFTLLLNPATLVATCTAAVLPIASEQIAVSSPSGKCIVHDRTTSHGGYAYKRLSGNQLVGLVDATIHKFQPPDIHTRCGV